MGGTPFNSTKRSQDAMMKSHQGATTPCYQEFNGGVVTWCLVTLCFVPCVDRCPMPTGRQALPGILFPLFFSRLKLRHRQAVINRATDDKKF